MIRTLAPLRHAARVAKPLSSLPARRWGSSTAPNKSGPAFCFDIDGVLKQGERVLPQALKVMRILTGDNKHGKKYPFILVTNGGGTLEVDRAKKLTRELETPIAEHQIVQSHTIFRSLVDKYGDKPVLIVGGRDDLCRQVAQRYGFKHAYIPADVLNWQRPIWPFSHPIQKELGYIKTGVDFSQVQFAAVFAFADSRDWGRDIQLILDLVRAENGIFGTHKDPHDKSAWAPDKQLPVYFSNPDLLWGNDFSQPRFGQGALQEATAAIYKFTTGHELQRTTGGKPSRATYEYASNLLNLAVEAAAEGRPGQVDMNAKAKSDYAGRVYMVGDNPESDIAGANAFGWESVLLNRTGVFRGETREEAAHVPTVVKGDVLEAVRWALEREGEVV